MKRNSLIAALALASLVSAGTAYGWSLNPAQWFARTSTTSTASPAIPPSGSRAADAVLVAPTSAPDYRAIFERFGPAVVGVTVEGTVPVARQRSPELENDPFFRFYRGLPVPPMPRGDAPVHGQGSGFIISADGLILTNAHVVRDARNVTVKLADRREFEASVLGVDPATDVAVLRIQADNLPAVQLGEPSQLAVGDYVLAIGSPFGFEQSATSGIVSAKGRSLPGDTYVPFIQTDVAVNPGNSGGPLFDARGRVVGINSQIYSRTGGYQGLSFAIPIEIATKVKDQIVSTGKVSHARLGVSIQEVNQAFADSFKLDKPEGALVSNVDAGGPADQAGLKTGDVIRKVNGQPIIASGDLPALIGQSAPGEKVTLEVWRQGKREELTARLGDASDKKAQLAKADDAAGKGKLGLALRPLQPQEKREAGVDGLLIEDAGGPAAMAGVQAGDVLMAVNGTPVNSIDQVRQAVARSDKSIALLIQRDGNKIFVPVRVG